MRLRLLDHGLLRDRLLLQPFDRRVLGCELVPGQIDGVLVIAVVDLGEDIAGADGDVVLDRNGGDDARDLRRDDREVGPHIGIVGRDVEPAFGPPIMAVVAADPKGGDQAKREKGAAFAGRFRHIGGCRG